MANTFCCDDIHFYESLICHMRNVYVCRTVRLSMMCVNGEWLIESGKSSSFQVGSWTANVFRLTSLNSSFCALPYFRHHFYARHFFSVVPSLVGNIKVIFKNSSQPINTKKMQRKRAILLIKQFIKMKIKYIYIKKKPEKRKLNWMNYYVLNRMQWTIRLQAMYRISIKWNMKWNCWSYLIGSECLAVSEHETHINVYPDMRNTTDVHKVPMECAERAVKIILQKSEKHEIQSYCIVLYCILLATKSTASTFSLMMNVAANIIGQSSSLFIIFNVNTFSVWLQHNLCICIFENEDNIA